MEERKDGEKRRIGIIGGTGPAGSGLAARLAASGHVVLLGSRDLDKAKQRVAELQERWGDAVDTLDGVTNAEATTADVVVLATVAESAVATAIEHADALDGRIVISMANLLTRGPRAAAAPDGGSVAIEVQRAVPRPVVGASRTSRQGALAEIDHDMDADAVICGDDADAVAVVLEIVDSWTGWQPLDGGPLATRPRSRRSPPCC
jgi:NADPH-dependent F420 reductase